MLYIPLKINAKVRFPSLDPEQVTAFITGGKTAPRMSSEIPTPRVLLTLKPATLTSKQHPLPAAAPTPPHLRAAPTRHSDTASAPPYSRSRLLLPGEWPVPQCTTGDGSRHSNLGCPERPTPAGPCSKWRSCFPRGALGPTQALAAVGTSHQSFRVLEDERR